MEVVFAAFSCYNDIDLAASISGVHICLEGRMQYAWENMFRPHILERGYKYYMTGSVLDLEEMGADNDSVFYEARVEGSAEYRVEIQLCNGTVTDMQCDCLYAIDGHNCKHMAAVLYKIEENRNSDRDIPREKAEGSENLTQVLQRVSIDELRGFLLDLCNEDERIKNRVLLKYSASVGQVQLSHLWQELEAISDEHSDRRGWINWEQAADYESAITGFLEDNTKILLERNQVLEAFEVICKTIYRVGEQDLDDSDGTLTGIMSFAYQCLSDVTAVSDQAEKETIFSWFEARIRNDDAPEYAKDMISAFFDDEFHDKKFLARKLRLFADEDLLAAEDDWRARYRRNHNIVQSLNIMEELDCPETQIQEYVQKYWEFSEVRKTAEKWAERSGDIEKAILIFKESKTLDRQYAGLVAEYSRELVRLYQQKGNIKKVKEELEFQIFSCMQSDLLYINMLKGYCGKEEWTIYRERILAASSCFSVRFLLMESEGMLERLLQEIVRTNSNYLLDRYEGTLKKHFPEQMRDAYVAYVNHNAEQTSDRKTYNHLVRYLQKVQKYPGGAEIAAEIAKNWRVLYYRRSAMIDELRKAGL